MFKFHIMPTATPIPLTYKQDNSTAIIYPTIVQASKSLILVDVGYTATLPQLLSALRQMQVHPEQLTAICITHDDIDHIEALAAVANLAPQASIYAHTLEIPALQGDVTSERLIQARSGLPSLQHADAATQQWAASFIAAQEAIERLPITYAVADKTIIENTLMAIATPGHTQGHTSYYVQATKTLIAGDAIVIKADGTLDIANPQFTLNIAAAANSVQKLAMLPIQQLICYHGGVFNGNIAAAFEALIQKYTHEIFN
jgi:glyoxylase-like metal-dependent hydrolase (beta-lactamase superfamily II)